MTNRALPSPATLRQILDYDPETGILRWKQRPRELFKTDGRHEAWNRRYAGKVAMANLQFGYRYGSIFKRPMRAHRVIWAIMTGSWPEGEIDHLDHCRSNNCWSNLRQVSVAENRRNMARHMENKSGVTGVCWKGKRWIASIQANKKTIHLGSFVNFDDAVTARKNAEILYGYHQNHGGEKWLG